MMQYNQCALMQSLPLVASVLGKRYGVTVQFGGSGARTDGSVITLPTLPLECDETLRNTARSFIDHESAHIRDTDFPALRAAKLSPLEHKFWNIVEDYRVEHVLADLYPGCRYNIAWMINHLWGEGPKNASYEPAARLVNWILYAVRSWDTPALTVHRDGLAAKVEACFPGLTALFAPLLNEAKTRCRSTADCIAWARKAAKLIRDYSEKTPSPQESEAEEAPKNQQPGDAGQQEQGESKSGAEDQTGNEQPCPSGGQGTPEAPSREAESTSTAGGTGSAEETPSSGAEPEDAPTGSITDTSAGGMAGQTARRLAREVLTAQKDELPQTLGERLAEALDAAAPPRSETPLKVARPVRLRPKELPDEVLEDSRRATSALRARLQGLMQTMTLRRRSLGHVGKPDTRSLHKLSYSTRVFARNGDKKDVDTAVHILLDCSGSMRGSMSLAACACHAVASALYPIKGLSVGVTAFPGSGGPTVAPLLRHGEKPHTRLDITAGGDTPLGEAIWWALQEMIHFPQPRKMLLLISDGDPTSRDNTREAIRTAHQLGFEIQGIGIGQMACRMRLYLPKTSRIISTIDQLAPAMFAILQDALLGRANNERRTA